MRKTMNIYSAKGSRVLFTGKNGYNLDKEYAMKHLAVGVVYTVDKLEVGRSSSVVFLQEVGGKGFNSVHFENVGDFELADPKEYNTYTYVSIDGKAPQLKNYKSNSYEQDIK